MGKIYTIEEIKEKVTPIAEKYGIETIWLFGSYARNQANPNSDVDILIEGFSGNGLLEMGHLYTDISASLEKEIDIVNVEDLRCDKNNPITQRFIRELKNDRVKIYANKS